LGEQAGWFALVGGNRHQAMWMATREQVHHLDQRCDSKWFNINEEEAIWVEWWSGALQLWYVRATMRCRADGRIHEPTHIYLSIPA
jgi:hypothetical protein